jgi:hypothetical protein
MVGIVCLNHYIACFWYGIAVYSTHERTWLSRMGITTDDALEMRYSMSLHWSLTQFTPATNDISPTNAVERVYACAVVLLAMVCFSSFISGVTGAVNSIRDLGATQRRTNQLIKDFLFDHHIGTELGRSIMDFSNSYFKRYQQRVLEQDITLFGDLPRSIRAQVRIECFHIVLMSLTPMSVFDTFDGKTSHMLCDVAVCERPYFDRTEIFSSGLKSTGVYQLLVGSAVYTKRVQEFAEDIDYGATLDIEKSRSIENNRSRDKSLRALQKAFGVQDEELIVERDMWCGELALWVNEWVHRGSLVADGSVHCALLDHHAFHRVVKTRTAEYRSCLARYATTRFRLIEIDRHAGDDPHDLSNQEMYWGDSAKGFQTFLCKRIANIVHTKSVAFFMLDDSQADDPVALDNALSLVERVAETNSFKMEGSSKSVRINGTPV